MESVTEAVRDAAKSAAQHATIVKDTISDTGLIRAASRFTYNGAYAISFGVVYAAVFVTQLLPQDNALMHGFSDGARAAMDSLEGA
jgi:hypothetical protein